jgi:hypothetical protein
MLYQRMPSQLATHVDAKPSIVIKLKFRCTQVNTAAIAAYQGKVPYSQHLPIAHNGHIMSVGIGALVLLSHRIASVVELLSSIWRWQALRIRHLNGCRLPMIGPKARHGWRLKGTTTTAMIAQKEAMEQWKKGRDERDEVRKS